MLRALQDQIDALARCRGGNGPSRRTCRIPRHVDDLDRRIQVRPLDDLHQAGRLLVPDGGLVRHQCRGCSAVTISCARSVTAASRFTRISSGERSSRRSRRVSITPSAGELDERYDAALSKRRMFVNDIYLTIIRRPLQGHAGTFEALMQTVLGKKTGDGGSFDRARRPNRSCGT